MPSVQVICGFRFQVSAKTNLSPVLAWVEAECQQQWLTLVSWCRGGQIELEPTQMGFTFFEYLALDTQSLAAVGKKTQEVASSSRSDDQLAQTNAT